MFITADSIRLAFDIVSNLERVKSIRGKLCWVIGKHYSFLYKGLGPPRILAFVGVPTIKPLGIPRS